MFKVMPFDPAHLDCMDMRGHEQDLCDRQSMKEIASHSVCKTAMYEGRVICCWGHRDTGHGTAEVWLIPSVYLSEMPLSFFKGVKKHLDEIMAGFNRMQTHCLDDELHNRWMSFIGFHKECVLKRFWNGADLVLWGKYGN